MGPEVLPHLQKLYQQYREYDQWFNQVGDGPQRYRFAVPTLATLHQKGLFITEGNTVHWDCEIQRLVYSCMAVHGAATSMVKQFDMFKPVEVKTMKKVFKKLLYQSELTDCWELKIDALRLHSWNYGMVKLMSLLN